MNSKTLAAVVLFLGGVGIGPSVAVDGANPLYQVTTITDSGLYIVTRDINVAAGPVITIAANNVTLDLGGKTLTSGSLGGGQGVIEVSSGFTRTTIRNGRIEGTNGAGIQFNGGSGDGWLTLRDLGIVMTGEGLGIRQSGASYFELARSAIEAASKAIEVSGTFEASISENRLTVVQGAVASVVSVSLNGLNGGRFTDNVVHVKGTTGASCTGATVSGLGGTLFSRNTLYSGAGCDSLEGLTVSSPRNLIVNNTVRGFGTSSIQINSSYGNLIISNDVSGANDSGFGGIHIGGSNNFVEGNQVTLAGSPGAGIYLGGNANFCARNQIAGSGAYGVIVSGSFNLIEDNQITSPSTGLRIYGNSNAYRDNFLRGCSTPVNNTGTGNTDNGGNIF